MVPSARRVVPSEELSHETPVDGTGVMRTAVRREVPTRTPRSGRMSRLVQEWGHGTGHRCGRTDGRGERQVVIRPGSLEGLKGYRGHHWFWTAVMTSGAGRLVVVPGREPAHIGRLRLLVGRDGTCPSPTAREGGRP